METKKEKFERIAQHRVNETIKKIRLIGNLSNRRNYDYEKKHVTQIIEAIENEVNDLKAQFKQSLDTENNTFKFK